MTWQQDISDKEGADARRVTRDLLALFSNAEILHILGYLNGVSEYDLTIMRSALACSSDCDDPGEPISAEAGRALRQLPVILYNMRLHQGGALFLFSHAAKSGLDDPTMEEATFKRIVERLASSHPKKRSFIVQDSAWTQIKGKIGELFTWEGAQAGLATVLGAVAAIPGIKGPAKVLLGMGSKLLEPGKAPNPGVKALPAPTATSVAAGAATSANADLVLED